jgi:hypothetical protein
VRQKAPEYVARALIFLIGLGAPVTRAEVEAPTLQVIGYAGVLGEWELTATVQQVPTRSEFVGPLTMTHVGICTQDGPEEKTGEIRLRLSASASRLNAALLIGGQECTLSASLSDSYAGTMSCPGKAPVPLTVWLK